MVRSHARPLRFMVNEILKAQSILGCDRCYRNRGGLGGCEYYTVEQQVEMVREQITAGKESIFCEDSYPPFELMWHEASVIWEQ